ncbi:site-specific integrase [Aurantiacibacter rhizosphaerae]|uniref:site-specific integrase n=1 Tax=Aurantiacibacter rhizosphaerae TaxID=2691582 RepID=UPI001366151E|nr:site-specific integrase [Aurantiacibacter rhizosphaerae]
MDDIEISSYHHYCRMVELQRGKVVSLQGETQSTRQGRIASLEETLLYHVDRAEAEDWGIMDIQARWKIEEMGWVLSEKSPRFKYLCEMLLRARLEAYRTELRKLNGHFAPDPEADPLFAANPEKDAKLVTTLGDLKKGFEAEKHEHWSLSTRKNYKIIFAVLEQICGFDTPVSAIDRDYCRDIAKRLAGLPVNYQKSPLTRGRSVAEAIEIAHSHEMKTIAPATINSHLGKLGAIVRYGRDKGWIAGNPTADLQVPDPIDPSEKRDPFTIEQLNLVFARSPWSDNGVSTKERPSRYWAPLAALFSGARLTEICGQRVDEMIIEEGIHAFHFRHRPDDRAIKNGKSRKVPVHPELLRLGFWDFVVEAQTAGREHLFPDVKPDKLGKWGDHTSKWFSRQVKSLDLKGRNLSFHSFRHSFEDALRRADLHDTPIGNALTGRWTAGVSKSYGSKYPVGKLHQALIEVGYPGLISPEPWS